jgi:DNA-binding transcriptional ArsR family regulator
MELTTIGRLLGEPARAAMLDALLSGEALAAGELARVAGVSAPTASEHLARLHEGGLVARVAAGRHRYYRLASPEVAEVLEALSLLVEERPVRSLRQSRADEAMRLARTCYDHLAGQLGVDVHDKLVARGALRPGGDGYDLSDDGERLLGDLGVAVGAARTARRAFARPCLDFTHRRPHLAGALGAAVCAHMLDVGWVVRRVSGERALRVTDAGRAALRDL